MPPTLKHCDNFMPSERRKLSQKSEYLTFEHLGIYALKDGTGLGRDGLVGKVIVM